MLKVRKVARCLDFYDMVEGEFVLTSSTTVHDFLVTNAGSFDHDDVKRVESMNVGDEIEYGGGAAALVKIVRKT